MTMPHLSNCSHTGSGWCLDCVKKLHDEKAHYEELHNEIMNEISFKNMNRARINQSLPPEYIEGLLKKIKEENKV